MNSLLRLDENGLNLLSSTFREIETSRRSGGLGLNEFIDAVVNALGEGEAARTAKLEDELCKVFAEIDVDGDNTVTWEEFSSHCIDAGVAASTTPVDYSSLVRFRLQQEFNQPQGRQLSFVKYLSSLSLLAVGEANNQCVKFYDSNCSFLGDFSADADIAEVRLTLDGTKDLVRKGRGVGRHITASQKSSQRQHTVLDIEFCPGTGTRSASGAATLSDLGTLVTSTSDVCCSFFKVTRTVKGTLRISLVNRVFKNLRSPQTVCHWSSVFCKLFTSDDSGVLVIWTVDAASGGKSRRRDRIREHQSRITCMASSQRFQLLFTAGLDKQILQWSSNAARAKRIPTKSSGTRKGSRKSKNSKLRVTAKFCGHRLGVTGISLVLMDSVLVSVGFEYEVYCWCTIGHTLLCKLAGHRYPLLGTLVCTLKSGRRVTSTNSDHLQEQLVSLDLAGNLRSWAISYMLCSSNKVKCVQELALMLTPKSFDILPDVNHIVISSYNLKLLQSTSMVTKTEDDGSFLLALAFNELTGTMVAGVNCSLYKWNLLNGKRQVFHKVTQSDITCTNIGQRGRKVYVGTMVGEILILNLANANFLRGVSPHETEVCGLKWVPEDNILISCSTDKILKVHADLPVQSNELTTGYEMKTVKEMKLCGSSTACMAFSRELSLIATGTSDGAVTVWDFQSAGFEGFCRGHEGDIINISFLGARPLMLVADSFGQVQVWAVRPHPEKYEKVVIDLTEAVGSKGITQILCYNTLERPTDDSPEEGSVLLACGDDDGIIRSFDVTIFFTSCPVSAIPPHKLSMNKPGYNPARHVLEQMNTKQMDLLKASTRRLPPWTQVQTEPNVLKFFGEDEEESKRGESLRDLLEPEAIPLGQWQAHDRQVTSLVAANGNIISCTFDLEARVWSWTGELLARLSAKEQDQSATIFHSLQRSDTIIGELEPPGFQAIPQPQLDSGIGNNKVRALAYSKSREEVKLAARTYSENRREREMKCNKSSEMHKKRNKILADLFHDS